MSSCSRLLLDEAHLASRPYNSRKDRLTLLVGPNLGRSLRPHVNSKASPISFIQYRRYDETLPRFADMLSTLLLLLLLSVVVVVVVAIVASAAAHALLIGVCLCFWACVKSTSWGILHVLVAKRPSTRSVDFFQATTYCYIHATYRNYKGY